MVWFCVILTKVYVVKGPADAPSMFTSTIRYPAFGVMVNVLLVPPSAETVPGDIVPFAPALAVMVYDGFASNVAAIVGLLVTFVKVYVPTAPTDTPSTWTSRIWCPAVGVMVWVWVVPLFKVVVPKGHVMFPPVPALTVMVNVFTLKYALMVWFAAIFVNV